MKLIKLLFLRYTKLLFNVQKLLHKKLLKDSSANNYFFKTSVISGSENKFILDDKCKVYHSSIYIRGKNNTIQFQKGMELRKASIIIKGDNNNVIIGENCNLKQLKVIIEKDGNSLTIGHESTSSGNVEIYIKEKTRIKIGNKCMFSRNIIMRTSDGHTIMQGNKRINTSQDINIGDKCWISQNVTILKGASLPRNTIVGVGTIVTKQFTEENTILGGIPAHVLKTNTSWVRELI